ncbi:MAG TPA: helix-turn-helix transcriptional regulator [Lacibacter sp.]|nr:helix-turn-helix transcriptional regulator [Lacibacter sp.]HMO87901.1 helix-turn-helix transcriptional regulator [Lacibacter sp.]HMP87354.1 helix-turn-helix transcriptional regulator [Lacibacter sp.]
MPSQRIRLIRLRNNLTQEYVAFRAGISQSQLSKYETGESVPNAAMLRVLADILHVELFEFFYESEEAIRNAIRRWEAREQ